MGGVDKLPMSVAGETIGLWLDGRQHNISCCMAWVVWHGAASCMDASRVCSSVMDVHHPSTMLL